MKWTFNQNCQLIIEEFFTKGEYENILYVVVKNDKIIDYINNPSESFWSVDIDSDGLYTIFVLKTNLSEQDLQKELQNWVAFRKKVESPGNSIGDWEHVDNAFSLCYLRKCTFELEKQSIREFLYECGNKKTIERSTRDILLIALFVLEKLVCENKYQEALSIIEQLGSCANMCNNEQLKKCNCNG